MKFPEKPTCHHVNPVFKIAGHTEWRPPRLRESKDADWNHILFEARTCSYCGSIHPEDLLRFLEQAGHTLGGADWKYGWPHKFYLQGGAFGKWYNNHLLDEGFDDEARASLITAIYIKSGIEFSLNEGRLGYRAPYTGYQK